MKMLKLFLLFSFGLWADFKLDIPNDINVSQLENIANNGWNESNVTLNNFIVSNVERVMPEILEKIERPIVKVEATKNDVAPVSQMILRKDDYHLIFSYCKYLEHQGKSNEALSIYIQILKGLHNIEDKSMLAIAVHVVFEKMTLKSMKNNVVTYQIAEEEKIYLKEQLNILLMKDTKIFWHGLEDERINLKKALEYDNVPDDICKQIDTLYKKYNRELDARNTEEDLDAFEERFLKAKNKILLTYDKWINKEVVFVSDTHTFISKWINKEIVPVSDTNTFISAYIFVSSIHMVERSIKEELLDQIKLNKKFIESL